MSSTEEDYIQNEYYAYNRRLLRLIGLWDYQRSFKKLIYICFINLLIIIAVFELIYAIINSRRELDSYTDLLQNTLPILCTGSCYYNLIWNNVIIKKIFYRMNYDWNAIAKKKESIKLKEYAKLSRNFTVAMIISFYLYVIFLIFPSFLRIIQYFFGTKSYNELELPVHFDHFAKYRMSYYPVLCLQYIVTIISCTTGVANYSIFIAVILHACALFNVVVWKINERFENNCYSDRENVNLSEEYEWIIDIIKFYRTVLEFVVLIKLFYEAIHTLEAFFTLIIIILDYYYLFQVLTSNISKAEKLTKLSYVIGSMFTIFAYFYFGQKLIDHSNKVFLTIRQIPFYSLSLKTQKILLFFTMRSMRLCNLSWLGAFVVSHNMFSAFIQKSLSFAMVLHSLQ